MVPSGHMTSKRRCTDVDATSSRHIDDNTTLFRRHVPAGFVLERAFPGLLLIYFLIICCRVHVIYTIVYFQKYIHMKIVSLMGLSINFCRVYGKPNVMVNHRH